MGSEDREVYSLVQGYENALHAGRQPYYDVEDLETIVNFYLDTGSYKEVTEAIKRASSMHPNSLVFKIKEVQLCIAQNDFALAQAKLHRLEGLADQHTELLIARAMLLMHQGNTTRALKLLDEALSKAEDPVEVLQQIVDAHMGQGDYHHAALSLERLIELEDDIDDSSIYQLALCLDFTHEYDKGLTLFSKLIEKEPYNALLWYQKGAFYLRKSLENEALESFDWATMADETFHAAYFEKGRIHERQDRLIEALTAYKESISVDVPSGYVHFRIGMIEQELGSLNEALRAFNTAIEIEPDMDDVFLERANVLAEMKRYQEAIQDYKKVWIEEAYSADDVIDYVECLVETEDLDNAISVLQNAVHRFEESVQLKLVLAGYLFATTGYEEAAHILEEALIMETTALELFGQYFPEFLKVKEITDILAEIQKGSND